jgi:hypothetical protein
LRSDVSRRCFCNLRLSLSCRGCCWRLDHHSDLRRNNGDSRARWNRNDWGLGDNRAGRRLARNRARSRWSNDGRRRPNGWHNLSRFRASGCRRCGRSCSDRRGRRDRFFRRRDGHRPRRQLRFSCLCFAFLLLGQNGLHYVARLGDMREVNLGSDCLRTARICPGTCVIARARAKLGAHFLCFILLERAGVGLTRSQA